MNYIVVMTVSGSGMLLLYFLQKYTWGRRLSKQWQYFFLKTVMAYYLVPLPVIGTLYRDVIRNIFPPSSPGYFHYYHNEKVLFRVGNDFVLNSGYRYRLLVMGIWCLISFLILTVQLIRYRKICKLMKRGCIIDKEAGSMAILDRLRETWGVKRRVTLRLCDRENTAFIIGVTNPVIICSLPEDAAEKEMLLEHELVHIKRMDILWKILGTLVKMLHWFNPLVYIFLREFEHICEESCDEKVVKGREELECRQYAAMVVERSASQEQGPGWRMALAEKRLSKNGERILERAEMIMDSKNRKNKWNGAVSALVIGAMVMLNSLTALAYEEVKVASLDSGEEDATDLEIFFDTGGDRWTETVLYDEQFIDEDGNIYPVIADQQDMYVLCNHTYVWGQYQKHAKKANGSCTVTQYEGQYCSKCGDCISGEELWTLSYKKCPH